MMGEAMPGMVLARSDGRRCMCKVPMQMSFFLHMYAMNISLACMIPCLFLRFQFPLLI